MSDTASTDIRKLIQDFVNAPTWEASRQIAIQHQTKLLSDAADASFTALISEKTTDNDTEHIPKLMWYRDVLQRCRTGSIDTTFNHLPEPRPLNKALEAFRRLDGLEELLLVIQDFPEITSKAAEDALRKLIAQTQIVDQHAAMRQTAYLAKIEMEKGSRPPIDQELAHLLGVWFGANTWEQSKEMLKANADRFLSNEAFELIDLTLLLQVGKDKSLVEKLLQNRTILEKACAKSIDAAYSELFKAEQFSLALQKLPDEVRSAIRALLFEVNQLDDLLEQFEHHPVLLKPQTTDALDTLLEELRLSGQEDIVHGIEDRYAMLKRLLDWEQNPLKIMINKLLQVDTLNELQQIIAEHPTLLDEETLNALTTITDRPNDALTPKLRLQHEVVVPMLRLRISEIRHLRQQRMQAANDIISTHMPHDDRYQDVEIHANRGIALYNNLANISQTNIDQTYNYYDSKTLEMKWQKPALQALDKTFVGREEELKQLLKYLSVGETLTTTGKRITATILGMAGIGKTYIAQRVAIELYSHFPAGVIWISLGPQIVDEASAQAKLGDLASYAFGGKRPSGQLQPEVVAAWLQEEAPEGLLVVFDDVWHQIPLHFLGRALPASAVRLATTRYDNVAKSIGGQKVTLSRLTSLDGLALLEDRLNCQGDTRYQADLNELVELLDGHALALNIAAELIEVPSQARTTLEDLQDDIGRGELSNLSLPPSQERDENLEKSLALSYERMTSEQQAQFRALGVFAPETPIISEAAAVIWGIEDRAARKVLFELKNMALLTRTEELTGVTYHQHGLLHVYARALLDKVGELTSASWAHAQYYKDMVERAMTLTHEYYPLLDQHMQNLLAALEWTAEHDPVLFSQLVEASSRFLHLRGQLTLLETYLPKAATAAAVMGRKLRQATLIEALGYLKLQLGHLGQARFHYDNALSLYREEKAELFNEQSELSDSNYEAILSFYSVNEANLLDRLGELEFRLSNFEGAQAYFNTALHIFIAIHDRLGEANILRNLGDLENHLSHFGQARTHFETALPIFRDLHAQIGEANVLRSMGEMEVRLGELDQAHAHLDVALSLYRSELDHLNEANVLRDLGELEHDLDHFDQAHTYFEAALLLYRSERNPRGEANTLMSLADLERHLGNLAQARTDFEAALPLYRSIQAKAGEASILWHLGNLEMQLDRFEQARARFNDALLLSRSLPVRLNEANALMGLGILEYRLDHFEQASTYLDTALLLYRSGRNSLGEANVLWYLGHLEHRLGNIERSCIHYEKASTLYRAAHDPQSEFKALYVLGTLELTQGHFEQACTHLDAAFVLARASNDYEGADAALSGLTTIFMINRDWTPLIAYCKQGLSLFSKELHPRERALRLINLGLAQFELGNYEQGLQGVQAATKLSRSVQDEHTARRAEWYGEWYLAKRSIRLESTGTDSEHLLTSETELLEAFINVQFPHEMLQLARNNPQVLTDEWFARIEKLIALQIDEGAKDYLGVCFNMLKQVKESVLILPLPSATTGETDLLMVFFSVKSPEEMSQLVQKNPQLLTDEWLTIIEEIITLQVNEHVKQHLGKLLDTLKQIRKTKVSSNN